MSVTDSETLQGAVEAFRRQRLPEAEGLLRGFLGKLPGHLGALNLLAVVLHAQGKMAESLGVLRQAVKLPDAKAEHFTNLGILLYQAGEFSEAIATCERAVEMEPAHAEGWYNLGNALLASRRSDEAITAFRKSIELKPDYVDACNNLGAAYRQQGRLRDAIGCCRSVLRLTPHDPKMHLNLGSLLRDVEQYEEAIAAYQQAVRLKPDYVDGWQNLGTLLRTQKRLSEAAECFQTVLRLSPGNAEATMELGGVRQAQGSPDEAMSLYQQAMRTSSNSAASWTALGTTMQQQGRIEEAMECYRKAIAVDPKYPPAYTNLGLAFGEKDQYEDAIAHYREALKIQPDFCEAWNNLGNAYLDMGKAQEAMRAYHQALVVKPDLPDGHWNKSLLLLLEGRLEEGFVEYEWRWMRFKEYRRHLRQPLWDGSDLGGRRIILYAEQGFGDTIQFARYVPLVLAKGGRVVLECQPELKELLQSIPGVEGVYGQNEPAPECELQMPLMTAAYTFGTTLETIPRDVPYLKADAARVAAWRERLKGDGAKLRVGLSWAGRPSHNRDRHRSCSLEQLAGLQAIDGVKFYSLQKWKGKAPAVGENALPVIDHTNELRDFSDTAALMENLDLIIGVDTAVVHLAGALGRPVWTMLAYNNDWRWLRGRADSPWYPTMRLFRQENPGGDWGPVIRSVEKALRQTAS